MNFGQILKNVLDKNHQVFIPSIGLLSYDKITSKLELDQYGAGSTADITALIAQINQSSEGEAKGVLIQEVEALKNKLHNGEAFSIEGAGDLTFANGVYQFESKKTLFPTNFFSGNNFNPTTFLNNAPQKEEITLDVRKVEEPEPIPVFADRNMSQLDNFMTEEVEKPKKKSGSFLSSLFGGSKSNKTELEENNIIEENNSIDEKIEENVEEKWEEPTEELIEPTIESTPIIDAPEEEIAEIIPPVVEEKPKRGRKKAVIEEEQFEAENLEPEKIDPTVEEEVQSYELPIIDTKKKIEEIVIDEPRRNIGKSRYDEGYYNYGTHFDSESGNGKWRLVGGIVAALFAIGFLVPWIIASMNGKSYLGMAPLWNSQKVADKKKEVKAPIVQKIDSTKLDTSKMIVANTKTDTVKKINQTVTSTAPVAAVNTTKPANTTPPKQNTLSKTPSIVPDNKKAVAVATITKPAVKPDAKVEVAKSSPKVKDTAKKVIAKKEKPVPIIGKPYATANYTKGNSYVNYGSYKLPSSAQKLKSLMKSKAGVETDIVFVDGTYRVVVPYINKAKAQEAAKDIPGTTIFE